MRYKYPRNSFIHPRNSFIRRKKAKSSSAFSTHSSQPHWIDIWLPRLSHFAQFGLFVFAVWGFYYTVLPIYQKSLLEESIAKKEVQLVTVTKALDSAYSRIRTYAVREFYLKAAPPCSGIIPREEDQKISGKYTDLENDKQTLAELVYSLDVPACLKEAVDKTTALNELRPDDHKLFDAAIAQLSKQMLEVRRASLMEYEAAPSSVTSSDIQNLPSDSFRVRFLHIIEKANGGKIDISTRRKLAEDIAKDRVVERYQNAIVEGIRGLQRINWEGTIASSK